MYYYAWGNNPKRAKMKGRACRILATGKMGSVLVEFGNGQKEITSRRALRKLSSATQPLGVTNMKPCDCIDAYQAKHHLNEQGISFNEKSIEVQPLKVILTNGPGQITFPMKTFKAFAEWYLQHQDTSWTET